MVDHVDKRKRSEIMRCVQGRNTGPERIVRSAAHRLGLRFRLHRTDLPGTPDIVLTRHRTVIFVNGCFWHRHVRCPKATTPKSNVEFWEQKFRRNVERDKMNHRALRSLGWRVVVIWQCQARNVEDAMTHLQRKFSLADSPREHASRKKT